MSRLVRVSDSVRHAQAQGLARRILILPDNPPEWPLRPRHRGPGAAVLMDFRVPRGLQDASKMGQEAPRYAQEAPRCLQDGPRGPQDGPRRLQDAAKTRFWCVFGGHMGTSWHQNRILNHLFVKIA